HVVDDVRARLELDHWHHRMSGPVEHSTRSKARGDAGPVLAVDRMHVADQELGDLVTIAQSQFVRHIRYGACPSFASANWFTTMSYSSCALSADAVDTPERVM